MKSRRPTALLLGATAGVAVAIVAVLAFTTAVDVNAAAPLQPTAPLRPTTLTGPLASPSGFFVDPQTPAARQQQQWAAEGRTDDARRIAEIAAQPVPDWLTQPTGQVGAEVTRYVALAKAAKQRPLFVPYFVPGRDCSSYSAGGAADPADYRTWIREVAAALRGVAATVVLEPDAVPHEVSGCGRIEGRAELLTDAVTVLKAAGPVAVYIDAGNPGFVTDTGAIADALKRSGVGKADGFALNVANFFPTPDVLTYGRAVSAAVGGKPFVVDTSRSGNGGPGGDPVNGAPSFCNPPGRAIGEVPTTKTGEASVDAYLWIKRVGESDGACRPGEPEAGQWWADYALGLVPK